MSNVSPIPMAQPVPEELLNFSEVVKEIVTGKKITKKEWSNQDIYGYLKDGVLVIHKDDGKDYQWIVSEADLLGEDYKVI